MLVLQIISALLLFLNKYYVRREKAIGWIYGILGAIAITIYFYFQMILQHKENLWIMVVLDIALVFLMSYGYLIAAEKKGIFKKWNVLVKAIIVSITIFVCMLLLFEALTSKLVLVQFFFAITLMFGTLLLAFKKKTTNIIGWVLYLVASIICTYIMIKTDSYIIAFFQILSGLVAIDGIVKETKK